MTPLELVLLAFTAALALPSAVFSLECLIASLPGKKGDEPIAGPAPRIAVLVPAHDEGGGIAATVEALKVELSGDDRQRVLVVADNCTDDTAERARAAGADVVTRSDAERRGKGFALAFGTEELAKDPPEVLVIVDADCRVTPGALLTIAKKALARQRPVQAEYLLAAVEPTPSSAVSALAFLVKNRVRPLGLFRLGLPCQLTGSGMAFPWALWRDTPNLGGDLVEDMVLGLVLARAGHPPLFAPEAKVTSVLPDESTAALGQRRRWEHGHISTLVRHGPRALARGLLRFDLAQLALGLDLIVPPLAFLVLILGATTLATGAAAAFGFSLLPAAVATASFTSLGVSVLLAWFVFGRATLPARHLIAIPFYVAWKLPLYVSLLVRGKQKTWVRTERSRR